MSAELLRRAAALMRTDWPPYPGSQTTAALRAAADWLDEEVERFGHLDNDPVFLIICEHALAVARAYLGETA